MSPRTRAALALSLLSACAPGTASAPDGGEAPADAAVDRAPVYDGAVDEVDAAPPDAPTDGGVLARHWPRSAAELRAAVGDRGSWTAAWQLDEASGWPADDLGPGALVPAGAVAYAQPGAWPEDRALGLAGDGAAVADPDPVALDRSRSLALLISLAVEPAPNGRAVVSKRGADGVGATLLAVDPATGHLSATLFDGARAVTARLPIDHRGTGFHDVLVTLDRVTATLRISSDLGRGPTVDLSTLGELSTSAPFTLGADADGPAAGQRVAFAALADAELAVLATAGDDALYRLRRFTERPAPIIRPPAGFPWVPPWPIRRERRGVYTIDLDPRDLQVATTADVWIAPTGDDAAAGTQAAPRRSVHAALAGMTAPTTIHLAPGVYDADAGWYGVSPAFDVNLIAEGGRAVLTSADLELAWQPSAAGAGVYEAHPPATPYALIDDRVAGVDPWLTAVGSLAEVVTTPGSWTASGGVVTVHTRDGRPPDRVVRAMPAATLNAIVDDPARTIYLEGIDLEGGYKALHVLRAHRLVLVDTALRYGATEGLSVLSTDEVLAFRARAEANAWDGMAYTTTAHVLEVDCVGRDNGRDGSNIDNGSTVHSGGTVIRLGGDYRDNLGPNVADVQGAWSWNLGTVAGGNRATQATQRVNFYIDGQLWLRDARALDATGDRTTDLASGPGAGLHLHDTDWATIAGPGTLDSRAE